MNFKFFKVDWYPDKASNKIDDFQVALYGTPLTDNVEGSQNIINSTVALEQLHFTPCILFAFADTADKNNQCQRTWEMLSRLSVKQAQACYKNKQIQSNKCLSKI